MPQDLPILSELFISEAEDLVGKQAFELLNGLPNQLLVDYEFRNANNQLGFYFWVKMVFAIFEGPKWKNSGFSFLP